MEKEFVNYNQALKLKELGFDESCFGFYQLEYGEIRPIMVDDDEQYRLTGHRTCKNSEIPKHYTSAPTFSQCFRWFREKHKGVHEIIRKEDYNYLEFMGWIYIDNKKINVNSYWSPLSYEEAELTCLDKLIEIIENKSK